MALINKLFLQKDAFEKVIVGSKIELFRWQKQLSRVFCNRMCWKISQSSQENTCAGVSFEQSCRSEAFNFIKKRLQHRCFAVNFTNLLKTPIQLEVCERLLLDWYIHAKLLNGFYKLSVIFFVACWGNSLPCYLFSPALLYAFDFKFYMQGQILIKWIVAL